SQQRLARRILSEFPGMVSSSAATANGGAMGTAYLRGSRRTRFEPLSGRRRREWRRAAGSGHGRQNQARRKLVRLVGTAGGCPRAVEETRHRHEPGRRDEYLDRRCERGRKA